MSVSICWRPVLTERQQFHSGTSSTLEILKSTFGDKVALTDIPILRAMALAAKDTFYNEVADVVEQYGVIEFWGEW